MRYQLLTLFCLTFVSIFAFVPTASASTITDSLARMDAIIKEMTALRAEFASLTSAVSTAPTTQPAGEVLGTTASSFFTQSLEVGATNSDIKKIQKLLATDKEIYPYGVSSGFFGPKTEDGIKNFQTRFGLKPVGIVGPATKALLEVFFAAYPDDIYPADVLKKKPTVLGASVSVPQAPTVPVSVIPSSSNAAAKITAYLEDGEADVRITYKTGETKVLLIKGKNKTDVINGIVGRTSLVSSDILSIIKFTDGGNSSSGSGADESDADDAINDADNAIDDVQNDIDDADNDVDVDDAQDTLDEASDLLDEANDAFDDEDYEEAQNLAEEAQNKADDAADDLSDAEDEA